MKLKADILEKLINDSIHNVKHGIWTAESMAIHEEDGIQVQIVVTQDEYDQMDGLAEEYTEAL